jgi:hypothetical protein
VAVMTLSERTIVLDEHRPTAPLLVHPGWLSSDAPLRDTPENEDEEARMRFTAFAQTMRTAGALDRASTDILGELGLTAGASSLCSSWKQPAKRASPRPSWPGDSPSLGGPRPSMSTSSPKRAGSLGRLTRQIGGWSSRG